MTSKTDDRRTVDFGRYAGKLLIEQETRFNCKVTIAGRWAVEPQWSTGHGVRSIRYLPEYTGTG